MTNTIKAKLLSTQEISPGIRHGMLEMENGERKLFETEGKLAASIARVYPDTTMNVVLEGRPETCIRKLTWFNFKLPPKEKKVEQALPTKLPKMGEFMWNFEDRFSITTKIGSFIWNDPDYGGDGFIRHESKDPNVYYGDVWRDKGMCNIAEYTDNAVLLNEVALGYDEYWEKKLGHK